ncbi:ammonium transporter [Leptospira sp. GIMC2001]|uniref:ammonium transporter n=1 Tax=Leptospira sp. GIMC2001 TaxID=1513297 RepID=UPI002349D7A9|nr:ammonium transporter [Leptospira sp. GIMC2001]WCL49843.1 ammonium transporter [Leptospira sp. GIMC2001]
MLLGKFDILWLIICSGLVFFMQAGFLCLESGLTRTKNSINVAIKNITDFGIATIVYYSIGFGLMYGSSYAGIFGSDNFLTVFSSSDPQIPVFFLFQLMFCGTAATIVSGAVAERMKFSAYIIVTTLISSTIYPIFGHWAWGKELYLWTNSTGWLAKQGFVDFAGSTVVHSVGGWVGLVAMIIIGSRTGKYGKNGEVKNITGHNLPIAMLGTLILWFGWIGFNGGSTLSFSPKIPGIIVNTMLSASGGMAAALIYGWIRMKYAEATLPLNGALAGLVAITASCHAVSSANSILIGIIAGILMFETRILIDKFKLDDAVGAIPVHLTGGIWGTLAVGIFGDYNLLGTGLDRYSQIGIQLVGILTCAVFALITSFTILGIVNSFYRLRVTTDNERQGLNYAEHRASTELTDLFMEMEYQKQTGDLSTNLTIEPFTEVGQIAERYNLVLDKIRTNIRDKEELTNQLEENLKHIQSDLATASKIQSSILSQEDKLIGGLEIGIRYIPLSKVGGDFFHISELKPGLVRVFLADATGHGVQAALITMVIKTLYESLNRSIYSVHEMLFYLNNEFLNSFQNLNQFFTCIIVDIDTNRNIIKYSSAGHNNQYLINHGDIVKLGKKGRMIGVLQNAKYSAQELDFGQDSQLLLFTDGLTEEFNIENEEFGEHRLDEIVKNKGKIPIGKYLDSILNYQKDFLKNMPIQDDTTILGIHRKV